MDVRIEVDSVTSSLPKSLDVYLILSQCVCSSKNVDDFGSIHAQCAYHCISCIPGLILEYLSTAVTIPSYDTREVRRKIKLSWNRQRNLSEENWRSWKYNKSTYRLSKTGDKMQSKEAETFLKLGNSMQKNIMGPELSKWAIYDYEWLSHFSRFLRISSVLPWVTQNGIGMGRKG